MPKRKATPKPKAKLCKVWPNCHCVVQGYYNERDRGPGWMAIPCGRKPHGSH